MNDENIKLLFTIDDFLNGRIPSNDEQYETDDPYMRKLLNDEPKETLENTNKKLVKNIPYYNHDNK